MQITYLGDKNTNKLPNDVFSASMIHKGNGQDIPSSVYGYNSLAFHLAIYWRGRQLQFWLT